MPSQTTKIFSSFLHSIHFLQPAPMLFDMAVSYGKSTFKKTSLTSHVTFLRRCLKSKVVPNGFRLSHTPSDTTNAHLVKSTHHVLYRASRHLMSTHIRSLDQSLNQINLKLTVFKEQLPVLMPPPMAMSVKGIVHTHNQLMFCHHRDIKDKKFSLLIQSTSTANPSGTTTSSLALPMAGSVTPPFNTGLFSTTDLSAASSVDPPQFAVDLSASQPAATGMSASVPDQILPVTPGPTRPQPTVPGLPVTPPGLPTATNLPTGSPIDTGSPMTTGMSVIPPVVSTPPDLPVLMATHLATGSPIDTGSPMTTGMSVIPPVVSTPPDLPVLTATHLSTGSPIDTKSPMTTGMSVVTTSSLSPHDPPVANPSISLPPSFTAGPSVDQPTPPPPISPQSVGPYQSHKQLVFTIPESLPLSEAERSVLSKGLKFIPLRQSTSKYKTLLDCERFYRQIRWMAVLENKPQRPLSDDIFTHLFQTGGRNPPPRQSPDVEMYINVCSQEIKSLRPRPLNHHNLTLEEQKALDYLKTRSDIVIKPADKGGAVVVWDRNLYIQEVNRQLAKRDSYLPIPQPTLRGDQQKISKVVKEAIDSGALPNTAKLLIKPPSKVKQPKFYVLPKIHKINNPGRPIVSACCCPTEHLSQYLDFIFQPLVKQLPSYIKDTTHTLNLLESFNRNPTFQPKLLFTLDVCSLYTSIPHRDGLKALKFFLDSRPPLSGPPTDLLIRLAELVLTLNTFEFKGEVFHQISGVAMGTKMGPSYANLFMGHLEHLIFSTYQGPKPELFRRFIDDCIGATTLSEKELLAFIQFANNFHPAIQLTHEISSTSVVFLDIAISICHQSFKTSVHYKPTDAHSYLNFHSSHPSATTHSIPFSQFLRLRRLCSEPVDFEDKAEEMKGFFLARDYPAQVLESALAKVKLISRSTALLPSSSSDKNSDRPIAILTHHPHNLPVRGILRKHWYLLQASKSVGSTFQSKPLFASRRDYNLRDLLVHSSFSDAPDLGPGTHTCQRPLCISCPHICQSTTVQGPSGPFKIKRSFSCTTTNLIYLISCQKCPKLYVGETERALHVRFTEHHADIRHNRHTPVGRHFNMPHHSINDICVKALWKIHTSTADRKEVESQFIHLLDTVEPKGLNIKL